MYLVHVHLRTHPRGEYLPEWTAPALAHCAAGFDGFEHVTVHAAEGPHPVIGLYLRAPSLEEAESAAEGLWWSAWSTHHRLRDWEFVRAEVPLLMPEVNPRPRD
ncbi:hypothetical protein AB0436_09745 [Streptomyces sp. NPDC051322]|uniref:hypothetical protein n=1 Tax=Streptomyces sp. NPDC051322 TaxID=3154645 RepID=UPI00344FF90F